MALNPPLTASGLPMSVYGEFYILTRSYMKFSAYIITAYGGEQVKADGVMYLTTMRICFVPTVPTPIAKGRLTFTGLDIPITHLSGEKYNQPIFGANSLSGYVAPLPGMGLNGPCEFKLTFQSGGAATFLHFLFRIIEDTRVAAATAAREAFYRSIASGSFVTTSAAYMDPSDPSVLYVTQPYTPPEPSAPTTIASTTTTTTSSSTTTTTTDAVPSTTTTGRSGGYTDLL